MGLKEFDFIDESIAILKTMTPKLDIISNEIENKFEDILDDKKQEYINVTSRVKSQESLREKIIRNRYLNKYSEAQFLIDNLTDLIGIRLECRFIEDENKIYRILKKHFNKTEDRIYYYNKNNPNIRLRLSEKQPSKQKNGFEIYKVDGEFLYEDCGKSKKINFELQIKSLVNIFWSEIEHKVIYKNNTYLLFDGFLKEMMMSIKHNLTMIDNQLLSIYKTFETKDQPEDESRKKEVKKLLSKLTYDTFSAKMRESMGFVVDFKKPCETILSYSLSKKSKEEDLFSDVMIKEIDNLNKIAKKDIDFTQPVIFENQPVFKHQFCKELGNYIQEKLSTEFAWNLFFKILFEVEPRNNKQDFEDFIKYIRDCVLCSESKEIIVEYYGEYADEIIDEAYKTIVDMIITLDSVEILYIHNLERMSLLSVDYANYLCREFKTYDNYNENKEEALWVLEDRLRLIFE